ncbi:amidophosphoribosyltransferase [Aliishimia ponticola]|uniref:Amidophosphoribosyltransferase n=1 Tax=Aliishimia ponticola TaxID=2499833 RepID=A0A4S4NLM7_9RHOB|nr:amidophosphoribosyltransferase [Aliishimia ponticola]
MHDLALLGTLTGGDAPRALLRKPGGRIINAGLGDRVNRHVIIAIEEGAVILHRQGGGDQRLALP